MYMNKLLHDIKNFILCFTWRELWKSIINDFYIIILKLLVRWSRDEYRDRKLQYNKLYWFATVCIRYLIAVFIIIVFDSLEYSIPISDVDLKSTD